MNRTTTILGLIIALLLIAGGSLYVLWQRDNDSWRSLYTAEHSSAQIWRNSDSTSQAHLKDAMVSIDVLKQTHVAELDKAKKEISGLKRDLSNLQSHTSIGMTTAGSVEVRYDTVRYDSISTPAFSYSDKWINLSGYFLRDFRVRVDYSVTDSISVTQYWKKEPGISGLFKPSVIYTDVISENPNSTIRTLKSISIREKQRRFSIGPQIGYSFPGGASIGIGLSYALIRF